jgi:hypothetical protein
MTATGHAVIGTVIAASIANPLIAIPVALGSHILADLFPHWDTATHWRTKGKKRLFIDSILDGILAILSTIFLVYFVFPGTDLMYTFIIVFFALLPDIGTAPYLFFGWNYPPFTWFYRFQKHFDHRLDKPWGVIGQIAVCLALVLIGWKLY